MLNKNVKAYWILEILTLKLLVFFMINTRSRGHPHLDFSLMKTGCFFPACFSMFTPWMNK